MTSGRLMYSRVGGLSLVLALCWPWLPASRLHGLLW